jgi:hypothetical protein
MTKVTVTCTLIIDQMINHSNFTHVVGKDTFHKEARPEVLKLWGPHPGGGRCWSSGGRRMVCMRGIFILNEIWAQHEIYILVGTLVDIFYLPLTTGTGYELYTEHFIVG